MRSSPIQAYVILALVGGLSIPPAVAAATPTIVTLTVDECVMTPPTLDLASGTAYTIRVVNKGSRAQEIHIEALSVQTQLLNIDDHEDLRIWTPETRSTLTVGCAYVKNGDTTRIGDIMVAGGAPAPGFGAKLMSVGPLVGITLAVLGAGGFIAYKLHAKRDDDDPEE